MILTEWMIDWNWAFINGIVLKLVRTPLNNLLRVF